MVVCGCVVVVHDGGLPFVVGDGGSWWGDGFSWWGDGPSWLGMVVCGG